MDPDTRANILSMALEAAQLDLERANMRLADAEGHKRRAQERHLKIPRQQANRKNVVYKNTAASACTKSVLESN